MSGVPSHHNPNHHHETVPSRSAAIPVTCAQDWPPSATRRRRALRVTRATGPGSSRSCASRWTNAGSRSIQRDALPRNNLPDQLASIHARAERPGKCASNPEEVSGSCRDLNKILYSPQSNSPIWCQVGVDVGLESHHPGPWIPSKHL